MAVMHGWNCMYKHEHTRNEWFESTTRLLTSMFLGVECFEVPYINIIFKLFAAVFQPETQRGGVYVSRRSNARAAVNDCVCEDSHTEDFPMVIYTKNTYSTHTMFT